MAKTAGKQVKPDKALIEKLEAEHFIEWPEAPKAPLPKPVMTIKKGKSIAQIVSEQRR